MLSMKYINDVLNNKSKFCQQLDLIDTNEHIVTLSYLITPSHMSHLPI